MNVNRKKSSPRIPDAVVLGTRLTEKALRKCAKRNFPEALVQEEGDVLRLDLGILRELAEASGFRVENIPGSSDLLLCRSLNEITSDRTLADFERQLSLDFAYLGLENFSLDYFILNTYSTFTSY